MVAEGIEMLANGGTYVEIGSIVAGFEFPFDPPAVCRKGLRLIGFMQYDMRILPRALDFVHRGQAYLPWDRLISHTFPLDDIQEAFQQAEWFGRDPDQAVITRAAVTP